MEHASIMNKKRRVSDQLLEALIYLCAFLAVGLLLGITAMYSGGDSVP